MKKISVLIADDEPLARQGIEVMLRDDPEIEIVASCADGKTALAGIRQHRPDVAFLDVQMPEHSGLDVFERLTPEERPVVIFVTAHDDYAVKAFELSAADYVLKPFLDVRFRAALTRAKEQVRRADLEELQRKANELLAYLGRLGVKSASATPSSSAGASRTVFKINGEHVFADFADIAWLEAQGELVRLRIGSQIHSVREPLHEVEKRLDDARFVRIHRSFIVNRAWIKKITPTLYGDHDVHMTDGAKLRMSRTYRDRLNTLLAPSA